MEAMILKKKVPETDVAAIYQKHQAALRGFIASRVNLRADAEDILQNVFYQLSKVDLVENPIEQMSAWLYSVARNQIIDRSRKKKEERMPMVSSSSEDGLMTEIVHIFSEADDDPEKEFLKSLVWEELERSLAELPAEQRAVFELTELQGFSFKEISESTGLPINTLLSRKRYAVLHLRKRLSELYKDLTETG